MFIRSIAQRQPLLVNAAIRPMNVGFIRTFHATSITSIKKSKKGKGKSTTPAADIADPDLPNAQSIKQELKDLEAKFKDTVEQFGIKSAESRQGKASTTKIGQMRIPLSSNEEAQELRSIANIQIKNNNRTIVLTVFDPKHVKYIQSGVLAELGVTPQVDSRNAQVVHITLPTRTADAKKELAKQIKQEYEHFRNSPSKHSLTNLREEFLKHIKKSHAGKAVSDDEMKTFNKSVETLFKKYSDELGNSFRKVEKTVLSE